MLTLYIIIRNQLLWNIYLIISLQQNHSPVSKTKTGRTPLHEVCVGGHKESLRTLLQYTPEVNIRDRDGQTPAHVAAFNGELGCIKMLQDKGSQLQHLLESRINNPYTLLNKSICLNTFSNRILSDHLKKKFCWQYRLHFLIVLQHFSIVNQTEPNQKAHYSLSQDILGLHFV